jgi:hypothetical protein
MTFQRVPNTAQLEVIWNNGLNIVENTHYFRKTVPPYGLSDLSALASAANTWAGNTMKPLCVATYTYLRCEVRGLNAENDSVVTNGGATGVGTRTGSAMAPHTALSIARKSVFTGRTARGRIYTFGMNGTDVTGADKGELTAGYIASWVTALAGLSAAAGAIGWTYVTVSRFNLGVKRAEAVTFDVANFIAVNVRVDTRRDRL